MNQLTEESLANQIHFDTISTHSNEILRLDGAQVKLSELFAGQTKKIEELTTDLHSDLTEAKAEVGHPKPIIYRL